MNINIAMRIYKLKCTIDDWNNNNNKFSMIYSQIECGAMPNLALFSRPKMFECAHVMQKKNQRKTKQQDTNTNQKN